MRLFLGGLLEAAVQQRGVAAFLRLLELGRPTPVANTGRCWLLRLGLYELTRPKEQADDWVWIVDHTIQLGPWKCLIVLGIRQSAWEANRRPLKHEDMALLNLTPMEHSSGEEVERQLRITLEQTGRPREILTDGGADLKSGIERFSKDYDGVVHTRDIKHKAATLLKKHLEADARWTAFGTQAQQTKRKVTQTELAYLNPPALKNKARYMNLEPLVSWGRDALDYLDQPHPVAGRDVNVSALTEKLGWLREYRAALKEWSELMQVVETTNDYVRRQGYHADAVEELRCVLHPLASRPLGQTMRAELLQFVGEQSAQAKPQERLIGSSEVIESVIGKYKQMQGHHSHGGMTAMILSIGAIVADRTLATIRQAFGAIKTNAVQEWTRTHLGVSLQAQRCLAFNGNKTSPQICPAQN